jgi:hypothetical protein
MRTLNLSTRLALLIAILVALVPFQSVKTLANWGTSSIQDSKKVQDELYATFQKGMTGDANARKAANEAGKEFLQKFPDEKDPRTKEIKEWMALYAADMQGVEVLVNVYKAKKYADAFRVGKQVLATDPENVKVLTALGYAGLPAASSGDASPTADSITYAKKAIQLIESGKAPVDWKPFASKEETLAWLNYSLGVMVLRASPSEALVHFLKAAQIEGAPKKDPVVYHYIAVLYNQEFDKQRNEFKSTYEGKPETPDSKIALEKVSKTVDLIIDAYARAISYTNASPQLKQTYQQQETEWTKNLAELYKSRHNGSDAGLKDLIATIQSKPLPGQPSPSLAPMATP